MSSNELDKLYAADAKLRGVMQEIREVIAEHEEWRFRVEAAARAVVEMRKHDAVAVLSATNVLLTEILGPDCWNSTKGPEVMP